MMMLVGLVPQLTPTEKTMTILFGLGILIASLYFFRRSKREHSAAQGISVANLSSAGLWRIHNTRLMTLCGVLMITGAFVDPRVYPRGFIFLWTSILVLVIIFIFGALVDLMLVRRRAFHEKNRLIHENRQEMKEELKDYYRRRSRQGNGRK